MEVITIGPVAKFLHSLEQSERTDISKLVLLLESHGHILGMPYAKPIGNGLWELRKTGRPQIRILYGFCGGRAILLVAMKKQRSALPHDVLDLARKRLADYCK